MLFDNTHFSKMLTKLDLIQYGSYVTNLDKKNIKDQEIVYKFNPKFYRLHKNG